jgi:pimeloyl-ACP methyl ester carboxylesterase
MIEHKIQTADGRTLAVRDDGAPDGRPVIVHMGTPNSRHLYGPNVIDAAARGLRLISWDRPGYGASTPQPGRTVADCAADARTICEALGIGPVAMWGISGGGPYVLACAALLPDLVVAVASLASVAPYPAEGIDWFAGMGQDNADDFRLMLSDEAAARARVEEEREQMLIATAADLSDQLKTLLTPADAAVLTGDLAEYLVNSSRDGLTPGSQGFWGDSWAVTEPWGFNLADISVPVLVMHGRQDQFVPFGHGEWLAGRIPGAEARLLDHDGHLTLLAHRVGEVHSWLAERLLG